MRKLAQQGDCLNRVQPRGVADHVVLVLAPLPVLAQRADPLGDGRVVGEEGSGVAECAEVLPRIEAVGGRRAGAGAQAAAARAVGLAGVLDHAQ